MNVHEVIIVLILGSAGFIRGAFGFGDALFAMPLLVFVLPSAAAAPLMAFAALLIAIVILLREWQEVAFGSVLLLTGAGIIGAPIGIWLLRTVDERIVKSILGAVIIAFSAWSLWRPGQLKLNDDRTAPLFGLFAGILGGAYNTAGPPLVMFATLRRWTPQRFRATMQAYCLTGSLWVITWHGIYGNITEQTMRLLTMAVPGIILCTLAGQKVTARLGTERFVRMVFGALILLGILLILSCVRWFD